MTECFSLYQASDRALIVLGLQKHKTKSQQQFYLENEISQSPLLDIVGWKSLAPPKFAESDALYRIRAKGIDEIAMIVIISTSFLSIFRGRIHRLPSDLCRLAVYVREIE